MTETAVSFQQVLRTLPGVSHIQALRLINAEGDEVGRIENKPGSHGSVVIWNHLAQTHGLIDADAARRGLELYCEHVEQARAEPGAHPNIDRLLAIVDGGPPLSIKHVFHNAQDLD